jgi:hypothetical protein
MDPGRLIIAVVVVMAITYTVKTVATTLLSLVQRRRDATPSAFADDRLSRLEQAVDAIALEVERISEGQRFTTKLLTDQARPAEKVARQLHNTPT